MDWLKQYHDYLFDLEQRKDWQRDKFHCSDLGMCPRKTIYRMAGLVPERDDGRNRRLRQGTLIHNDYAESVMHGGVALSEVDLARWLPAGWVGTTDALYVTSDFSEIADFKSIAEAGLRHELPKLNNCLQLGAYWGAAEKMLREVSKEFGPEGVIESAKLIYIPLGSFKEPVECVLTPSWKNLALGEMVALEADWETYQREEILPEPRPPEWKETKKFTGWQQNWECSRAYCEWRASDICPGGPSAI